MKRNLYKLTIGACMFIAILMSTSCNKRLKHAIAIARDNSSELKVVLKHFESDPNPLKYKAAKFLIENMPSQFQIEGNTVDIIDSIYVRTGNVSLNVRTKYFEDSMQGILPDNFDATYDISTIKAEYLIKAIDNACDAWSSSTWHEDFDESIFFEYVLPYRLSHEPRTDWHATINEEYPLLSQNVVMSRRGLQFEAEHDKTVSCVTKEYVGASSGKAEMMLPEISSISFVVNTERHTQKRLIMKYASIAQNLSTTISINGVKVENVHLVPTRNSESFTEKWFNFPIPFKKGKNVITISSPTDTLCIDYIQLGALEEFSHDDIRDFSADYYNIVNAKSRLFITYDTAHAAKTKTVCLKKHSKTDSTQLLRLDYAGYPLWRIGYYRNDSVDMCLKIEFGLQNTLSPNTPVTSAKYIKRPFDQWLFIPVGDNKYRIMNKHTGLFLDFKKDSVSNGDILIQNKYTGKESQVWELHRQGKKTYADLYYKVHSAMSEAMRVFDLTHQFEYYIYSSPFGTNPNLLFKTKSGKCTDEASFTIYLCRQLGIPAAYDFTPHWGNRSSSHSWSVLINEQGKSMPFYMGNFPGDTAHYFNSYIKPKVFRYRYSMNKRIALDMKYELDIPKLFQNPHFTDVTSEYCTTSDIERPIPDKIKNNKIAYICVFDNRNWVSVYYGNIRNGKVIFKSMGRGIAYMAATYENGEIVPFGNPFILNNKGKLKELSANTKKTITMKLLRKYPFMGAQDYFNSRMDGGLFQGSNNKNFSDSTILHKHKGITNGNWYNIPVKCNKEFKYLRYIGGRGSFCNINELEFYDSEGTKIEGTIIGTEGEPWARKENVFDNNILTGFSASSPDGNWVGLELKRAMKVSKIKYIGRNDGNGIETGDEYELYYWNSKGFWDDLGKKKATDNVLLFHKIPTNGLYVLKDLTKGKEERIFTYEEGKQVWW